MTAFEILMRCTASGLELTPTDRGLHASGPVDAIEALDEMLHERCDDIRAILLEHREAPRSKALRPSPEKANLMRFLRTKFR